jgi:hypothetical protein
MKLPAVFAAIAMMAFAHSATAQASRTWVSGVGDDANPGSRTAPCKTFAGAISKTAAKGVISVLDPGGFGTVTITQSITLDGGGIEGGILGSLTNGIVINAAATDVVILRNLQIEGVGTGLSGVRIVNAGAVYLENCRIQGFQIGVNELSSAASGTQIFLNNSTIQECGDAGISLAPALGAASVAMLNRTRVEGCGVGIRVDSRGRAILSESTVAFSVADGLKKLNSGVIQSFRNNRIVGNTPDGVAAPLKLK